MEDSPVRVEGNTIQIRLPNLANLPSPQVMIVQERGKIDRKKHPRINATHLLLDANVSRAYFDNIVAELKEKADAYKDIWTIRLIYYPNVFINVYSMSKELLLIISLNYRNYNYFPPQAGFLTPEEKILLRVSPDIAKSDSQGIKHLIHSPEGLWVCTPGTFEYHDFYFDLDRWELDRYGPLDDVIELINRIISFIDRNCSSIT
ncbi:MAG: hypothetical protein ACE5OZ_25080 [Candidatus Heimdallarchaeota archaeon]